MLVRAGTWSGPTSGTRSACAARRAISSRSTDFFVRSDHSITREFDQECRESGPLYRMGAGTCYQVGFAGVACGIARGALDSFVDVARNKVPRGVKSPLRDNAVVQSNLAQAEVDLRAARGFLLQSMADIWKDLSAGATITVEQRITIRMAVHPCHPQGTRGGRLRLQCRRRHRDLREPSAGAPLPRHPHRDPAAAGPAQPF